jgi:hypothetical protein
MAGDPCIKAYSYKKNLTAPQGTLVLPILSLKSLEIQNKLSIWGKLMPQNKGKRS